MRGGRPASSRRVGTVGNTIRTGWWSGWDQVMKDGEVREDALRSIEAFLMTARAHNLAVQFTFFAFTPDVFGGANPCVAVFSKTHHKLKEPAAQKQKNPLESGPSFK